MLPSTVGQGTYAAGSVHSPYITEGVSYGSGFSFNALTHDSPAAIDHMQTNGGSFWESRAAAAAKQQGEQCLICHGPNRVAAISLAHSDKTP